MYNKYGLFTAGGLRAVQPAASEPGPILAHHRLVSTSLVGRNAARIFSSQPDLDSSTKPHCKMCA